MKRVFTKLLLVITILFCSKLSLKAQDFLPFANDNYAGITGVHFQPASIADSRYKFDLTLMGLSLDVYNNYFYIDKYKLPEMIKKIKAGEAFDTRDYVLNRGANGLNKYVYQDVRLDLMNFMVTVSPRISIGLTTSMREIINIDNIDEGLANVMYEGYNNGYIPFNTPIHNNDLRIATNAWAEFGISLAGVVYKSDKHVVKAGMNAKLLKGLTSAYVYASDVDYVLYNNEYVDIQNTAVEYGVASNLGGLMESDFDLATALKGKSGVGFDFGVVWEWRPNFEDHRYDMDGKTNLERRNENKYKLKVGLSVTDIGGIKYDRWDYSKNFVINGLVYGEMFEEAGVNFEEVYKVMEELPDIFDIDKNTSNFYKMSLPTAISLQVDYNIYKNLYINFTPYLALKRGYNTHTFTNISLTPRYETSLFGISIPVQYNQYTGFSVGTGLRLGPIWIGSNNLLSTFFNPEFDNLNIQVLTKIPILYSKVKDRDGDKVSNRKDRCKDVPGVWENYGCPLNDLDEDGIPDDEDDCPDVKGLALFNGCPDSDNDSIPDHLDECPNMTGLAKFGGCPDSDGDGLRDIDDECPNIAGPIEFKGCPDSDSDGLRDPDDACPNLAGPIEFNGCPDSDGDGLRDSEDECPNIAGPIEFNGCPDTDGDGLSDSDDGCPTIPGPTEFGGCPDSDNDSIPDNLDKCPLIKGLAQFNGCPDTDGDGIQDTEDECPEEPGSIENNGCPVYEKVEFATHIGFQSGSDKLTKESYPYLDQLVQIMIDNPNCWVKLDGHTDNTGSDAVNNKLSQKRVDAIKYYLVDKGINPNRIIARGYGSSKPIAPNNTAEGRSKNRRVEINIAH
jgi:outer membrane protein OmpA-like peptidoglycan-associated protein